MSFSDPRIKEYMEDGGQEHNQVLSEFLLGIAVLSVEVYGSVDKTQQSILFQMDNGASIHEAAIREYEFLRARLMG